jgi:hypothetical protein
MKLVIDWMTLDPNRLGQFSTKLSSAHNSPRCHTFSPYFSRLPISRLSHSRYCLNALPFHPNSSFCPFLVNVLVWHCSSYLPFTLDTSLRILPYSSLELRTLSLLASTPCPTAHLHVLTLVQRLSALSQLRIPLHTALASRSDIHAHIHFLIVFITCLSRFIHSRHLQLPHLTWLARW